MIKARFSEGILTLKGKTWSGEGEELQSLADFFNTVLSHQIELAEVYSDADLAGFDSPSNPNMEHTLAKWTVDNFDGEIIEESELPPIDKNVLY